MHGKQQYAPAKLNSQEQLERKHHGLKKDLRDEPETYREMYDAVCKLVRTHAGTDDAEDVMQAMTGLYWYDVTGALQHRTKKECVEFLNYVQARKKDEKIL